MDKIIDIFDFFKMNIKNTVNIEDEFDLNITLPKLKENGHISTNAALKLSSRINKHPIEVADYLSKKINIDILKVDNIEIATPGFINFFLSDDWIRIIGDMVLKNGISIVQKPIEKEYLINIWSDTDNNSRTRATSYFKVLNNIFMHRGYVLLEGTTDTKTHIKIGRLKLLRDKKEVSLDINDVFDQEHINFYSISRTYKNSIEIRLDSAFINNTSNPYFYITYICDRASNVVNILERQGYSISIINDDSFICNDEGRELIFRILQLEEVMDEAIKHKEPYKLFDYIYSYSELFYKYNSKLLLRTQTEAEILSNLYILKVIEKFTSEVMKLMLIIK